MAETIQIILEAIDKASNAIKSTTKSIGGLDSGLADTIQTMTGFNMASITIAGGVALVGTAIKKSIDDTLVYAQSVKDLSQLTGEGAENTSRLIQVSNELSISQKDLSSAMEAANKKGISTSIAGLMTLSDEYLFLQTTVEKNQFLLEKFGASGLEMADMMELGAAGILKMSNAVDENKVLTEDNIKSAAEYKKAIKDLTVELDGLTYALGNGVIPYLVDFLRVGKDVNQTVKDQKLEWMEFLPVLGGIRNAYLWITGAMKEQVPVTEEVATAVYDYTANTKAAALAAKEAEAAEKLLTKQIQEQTNAITALNKTRLSMVASFQSAEESYQNKFKSLNEERLALEAERSQKISQGYWVNGEDIRKLDEKLAENSVKVQENADEYEKASKKILLGYLEQNLMRDGLSTKETAFLLEKGREWGIYSDTAVNAMSTAMAEADRLADSINGIPNRTVNINVVTTYSGTQGHESFGLGGGYASGANFIVPPGYPNDSFPMRVQSGEHVQVTPAGKSSAGSGVTLVYSPMISLANEAEAERVLLPMLRKLQRAA